jgi:hypothetical protein
LLSVHIKKERGNCHNNKDGWILCKNKKRIEKSNKEYVLVCSQCKGIALLDQVNLLTIWCNKV